MKCLDLFFSSSSRYRRLTGGEWFLVAPWPSMPHMNPIWVRTAPTRTEKLIAYERWA